MNEVVAIEPERHLRELAEQAARAAAVSVRVVDALAEALPFEHGGFDAAVASLVLCSVGDVRATLAELHRVVRRDGDLRFFEHVARSDASFGRSSEPRTQPSGRESPAAASSPVTAPV